MPKTREIDLITLNADKENPRLSTSADSYREAIRTLLKEQEEKKLLTLAEDIVEFGLSPAEMPMVVEDEDGQYTVLDGNRRIVALRVLDNPELAKGILTPAALKRLQNLSKNFHIAPVTKVLCVLFDSREEALRWIELRHTGQNDGAGVVPWGSEEVARFNERQGKKEPHVQILDLVKATGKLSLDAQAKLKDLKASTLKRIITNSKIRERIGYKIQKGKLVLDDSNVATVENLTKIVEDLAVNQPSVSSVYRQEQIVEYVDQLIGSPKTKKLGAVPPKTPVKIPKPNPKSTARTNLIPKNCILKISHPRVNDLYHELQNLNINDYPNAVAVLIRVFLELSLNDYLDTNVVMDNKTPPARIRENSTLSTKISAVAKDLEDRGIMLKHDLKSVRRCAAIDHFLVSHDNLHAYVHNKSYLPIPNDLKNTWDTLQVFFENLWPV
jgi:hypothetical protein